jgi:hypothetical protein
MFYRIETDFAPFATVLNRFNALRERMKQTPTQIQIQQPIQSQTQTQVKTQRTNELLFIDEVTILLFHFLSLQFTLHDTSFVSIL